MDDPRGEGEESPSPIFDHEVVKLLKAMLITLKKQEPLLRTLTTSERVRVLPYYVAANTIIQEIPGWTEEYCYVMNVDGIKLGFVTYDTAKVTSLLAPFKLQSGVAVPVHRSTVLNAVNGTWLALLMTRAPAPSSLVPQLYTVNGSGAPCTGIWHVMWQAGVGIPAFLLVNGNSTPVALLSGQYAFANIPVQQQTGYTLSDGGAGGAIVGGVICPA